MERKQLQQLLSDLIRFVLGQDNPDKLNELILHPIKERQKVMREQDVIAQLFYILKVRVLFCAAVLWCLNAYSQAPFAPEACTSGCGVLLQSMEDLEEQQYRWLKKVCVLCYRLIRHLATDYRKNQEVCSTLSRIN